MIIYRNFDHIEGHYTAAIGFFDGVHVGHRFLVDCVRREAAATGTRSAVVTFAQHPRRVVQPDYDLRLLQTEDERLAALDATGLDACFVLDFTEAVRRLSARDFIADVLARRMHVVRLLVGYDHRFGRDRAEGFADYVRYGAECGLAVVAEPPFEPDGALAGALGGRQVSSSAVRRALAEGDVQLAALMLGRPHAVSATVVAGQGLGRRLGFPTANLQPVRADLAMAADGVYAVRVDLGDAVLRPAVLNIGRRPTVTGGTDAAPRTIETHLIDFDGDLYGRRLTVHFDRRLRDERRFPTLDALRRQLDTDVRSVRAFA